MTARALFLGGEEQHQRRGVLRQLAANEGFVCKQQTCLELDDRLKHHVDVVASERANTADGAKLCGGAVQGPVQALVGHWGGLSQKRLATRHFKRTPALP